MKLVGFTQINGTRVGIVSVKITGFCDCEEMVNSYGSTFIATGADDPEGGENGGTIIAAGTPEQIAEHTDSYTGHYLKPVLNKQKLERNKLEKTG